MRALSLTFADATGWDHMGSWGWGMMLFGWLFMVALIAFVGWAIWSTVRPQDPRGAGESRASQLLDERYARGEIDRNDYLERRSDLDR